MVILILIIVGVVCILCDAYENDDTFKEYIKRIKNIKE